MVDLVSTNPALDDPLVAKQWSRPLAIWGLLLCRIDNNRVVLPTFTDAFLDCFRQPTEEGNKRLFKQSLQDHADELAQLRDYLKRATVMPLRNAIMSSYWLKGNFHSKSLDDDKHLLTSNISA